MRKMMETSPNLEVRLAKAHAQCYVTLRRGISWRGAQAGFALCDKEAGVAALTTLRIGLPYSTVHSRHWGDLRRKSNKELDPHRTWHAGPKALQRYPSTPVCSCGEECGLLVSQVGACACIMQVRKLEVDTSTCRIRVGPCEEPPKKLRTTRRQVKLAPVGVNYPKHA
jgi:hypothetical protein